MARKKLPKLGTRADVARFFETHDAMGHGAIVHGPLQVAPGLERRIRSNMRTRQIALRLHEWMIAAAKDIGTKTGVPYQVLLRLWIAEGIHRTAGALAPARSRARRAKAS